MVSLSRVTVRFCDYLVRVGSAEVPDSIFLRDTEFRLEKGSFEITKAAKWFVA